MTKAEREELASICEDIRDSDEQTDALVRLYDTVKRMIYKKNEQDYPY